MKGLKLNLSSYYSYGCVFIKLYKADALGSTGSRPMYFSYLGNFGVWRGNNSSSLLDSFIRVPVAKANIHILCTDSFDMACIYID
jgi:hypothetical protein